MFSFLIISRTWGELYNEYLSVHLGASTADLLSNIAPSRFAIPTERSNKEQMSL